MDPDPSDIKYLKLLQIFYYVFAGLHVLVAIVPLFYIFAGGFFFFASDDLRPPHDGPPPELMGGLFLGIGVFAIMVILTSAILQLVVARSLLAFKRYTLTLVVAGFNCILAPPIGTGLGVLTFVVLLKDSVKALYEGPPMGSPYR